MRIEDIPDMPILQFLLRLEREEITESFDSESEESIDGKEYFHPLEACRGGREFAHSILHGFPDSVTENNDVVLLKIRDMHQRGLIDGCMSDHNCRGDWSLTDKGREIATA